MGARDDVRTGGCLCGAVRYSASGAASVLHCHCENCRRLSGNFVAASRTDTEALEIEADGDALGWHELEFARYGFCRRCGSTLFFRADDRPQFTSVMVGTFDDGSGLELESVWFSSEIQDHNVLPDGVARHSGNG